METLRQLLPYAICGVILVADYVMIARIGGKPNRPVR
jgi:hypothetical protein